MPVLFPDHSFHIFQLHPSRHDAHGGSTLLEGFCWERLGEAVSDLLLGREISEPYHAISDLLLDVVVLDVDVPCFAGDVVFLNVA